METFEREISFLSKIATPASEGDGIDWVETLVKKTATFKELNRTAKDQHKLHFKILGLFETFTEKIEGEEGPGKIKIETDAVYDLTTKAIKTLILIDANFTAEDKQEFLNDSGAIFTFGIWLLGEKITPFFSKLNMT